MINKELVFHSLIKQNNCPRESTKQIGSSRGYLGLHQVPLIIT
jgi:hypothetical protein